MTKRKNMLKLYEKFSSDAMDQEYQFSKEEKRAFMEAVRNYSVYGESIYRGKELVDIVSEIEEMVEMASNIALKETEDGWMDNITVNRHAKQMKDAVKVLKKEAKEIVTRQQRLEAAYEDVGQLLQRYYDV